MQPVFATPINDNQLLTLAATQLKAVSPTRTVAECVAEAMDIMAETVVQYDGGKRIAQMINEKNPEYIAEQQALRAAQGRGLMVPGGPIPPQLLERNRQRQ